MNNTFYSFKVDITPATDLDSLKTNAVILAKKIGQPLQTGWSIDAANINQTGDVEWKEEDDEYGNVYDIIDLNHVSGSALRMQIYSGNLFFGLFPPNSDYALSFQRMEKQINILNYSTFFISVDVTGKGFCFYYKAGEQINVMILGHYIHDFCYPSEITSPCEKLIYIETRYQYNILSIVYFFKGVWWSASNYPQFNCDTQITPIVGLPSDTPPKIILSPYFILDKDNKPYGFIDTKCLSYINYNTLNNIEIGNLINNGNYILGIAFGQEKVLYALGWSPTNSAEVNPWNNNI